MQLFGRSVEDPAAPEYINAFYDRLQPIDTSWQEKAALLEPFITAQQQASPDSQRPPRCCVITSGSVATMLDSGSVNTVETIGSGNRGAGCAEAFLQAGYYVIFLYRAKSLRPFSRWIAKKFRKTESLLDQLEVNESAGRLEMRLEDPDEVEKAANMLTMHKAYRGRLLELPFLDLQEYLFLFRACCRAIAPLGHRACLFLSAGLTKKYIPKSDLRPASSNPLDQKDGPLKLSPVPHVVRVARTTWCPKAMIISFKLQTDYYALTEDAHQQLEKLGNHLVVANLVASRGAQVLLVSEREEVKLILDEKEELEESIVRYVSRYHKQYSLEREALKSGKTLLCLSAKFCMFREDINVLDEDAAGNKNVPFKVGIRIKAKRKDPDSAIYELKSIYNNKSKSARCHIWEKVGPEALEGGSEIVVSFSPAGTPDTVLKFFSDTWTGWMEEEVRTLVEGAKKVPLSSYIKMLAAPVITADFSEAAILWDRFVKSLTGAWRNREKPQFVSAMSNLLSLGFDRSLCPLENLLHVKDLVQPPPILPPGNSMDVNTPPPSDVVKGLREMKLHKSVFRGQSIEEHDGEMELLDIAKDVRIHNTVRRYGLEMLEQGVLMDILSYVRKDPQCRINLTGYSLGGMLSQLFALWLGEALKRNGSLTNRVRMVAFGSPRIGNEGLKARLRLLYPDETCSINAIYPLDTVHAFPPASEGFSDACLKIFLRQPGQFTGRRRTSYTHYSNPLTWLRTLDQLVDDIRVKGKKNTVEGKASRSSQEEDGNQPTDADAGIPLCDFCKRDSHSTSRHRCHLCTERGSHRSDSCPNKARPCTLCFKKDHMTGLHQCSVCKLYGHRGRDCHAMQEVGWSEMISYALFHDYYYYSNATVLEEDDYKLAEPSPMGLFDSNPPSVNNKEAQLKADQEEAEEEWLDAVHDINRV